jgi:hypothetical protein
MIETNLRMKWLKQFVEKTGMSVRVVRLNGAPLFVVPTAAEAEQLRHQGLSPAWTEKTLARRGKGGRRNER